MRTQGHAAISAVVPATIESSPDGAKRNPCSCTVAALPPHCASLHAGYASHLRSETDELELRGTDAGLEFLVVQRQRAAAARERAVIEHRKHHLEQQRLRRLLPQPVEEAGTLLERCLHRQHELVGAFLVNDLHHRLVAPGVEQNRFGLAGAAGEHDRSERAEVAAAILLNAPLAD